MKRLTQYLFVVSSIILAGRVAYAVPCDVSTNCELPSSDGTTQAGWTTSASGVSGVKALNSVGPTGNATGSRYFFGAVSGTGGAATLSNGSISTTGDGTKVLGAFSTAPGNTPSTTISGGNLQQLLGGQGYSIYAQACPTGTAVDGSHCSLWAKIGTDTTLPYPTTVFAAPIRPTDSSTNTINVRTAVPAADDSNISQINNLEIDDLINALSQSGISIGWHQGNAVYPIDSSIYTGGFKPNTKYQYKGQVTYPAGVDVPIGGQQTEGPIWTVPVNPGPVMETSVTHCSAVVRVQNAASAPPNPTYTSYNTCLDNSGGCTSHTIAGTPLFSDTTNYNFTSLTPGATYVPSSTALVGNNDGSSAGYSNSGTTFGSSFVTLSFGLTTGINSVTTTSASYTIAVGNTAGLTSYQIFINGVGQGIVAGTPPASISLTGLTPDTAYTIQIQLNEASCQSATFGNQSFTTTAAVPGSFTMTANSASQITAAWTANSNPGGITYHVQYCLDAGFTLGCATQDTTSLSAALTGLTPETLYFGHVQALTVGGGISSAYSSSASATTFNAAPSISAVTCTPTGTTQANCTATASDNGGTTHLLYSWNSTPAATSIVPNNQVNNNATLITFPGPTSYQVSVTVIDHDGSGLPASSTTTVTIGTSAGTVTITPTSASVGFGLSSTFAATVTDQFGTVISGQPVNWGVTGAGNSVSPTNGASTTFTASNIAGTYVLTASTGSKSATASITVAANTVVVTSTSTTVQTGNVLQYTATATDPNGNPVPSPVYAWSISPTSANSITTGGLFSAAAPGNFTVQAQLATGETGTKAVTVIAAGPYFTSAPTVTLNSDHKTAAGSALGTDNVSGSTGLIYTWSVVSPSGAAVAFAPNGTASAHDTVLTFSQAGTYVIQCTLANANGTISASAPSVMVAQVLTSLKVCTSASACPASITIPTSGSQQFVTSGLDQFTKPFTPTGVVWSATTGVGNITTTGAYTASATLGQVATITGTVGSVSGTITVSVVSFDVSGAHAFPVPYKANMGFNGICFTGLGSEASIRIYTPSGHKVFDQAVTPDNTTDCNYRWNLENSSGEKVASGVYFFKVASPGGKKDGKLIIIQ